MKRELVEDKQEENPTMFSKLHTPKFHPLSAAAAAAAAPSAAEYSHEADSGGNGRPPFHDGASIEVVRRPRGRPPGSKNKPKAPVIITREAGEAAMSPYVLELPAGVDIVDATARFCRRRGIGLCLLNGNGAVSNVTLKQPSSTAAATVTFHGRFDILSISATILPPGGGAASAAPFALTLAGPQGQVVGGHVVGPLVSAGIIYLVAANFSNPSFHRLQPPDQEREDSGRDGDQDSPKTASGGGGAMYSYQPSDVIWAPATRHPPPPPY